MSLVEEVGGLGWYDSVGEDEVAVLVVEVKLRLRQGFGGWALAAEKEDAFAGGLLGFVGDKGVSENINEMARSMRSWA